MELLLLLPAASSQWLMLPMEEVQYESQPAVVDFWTQTNARTCPIGPFAMEGWGGLSTSHAITKTVRDSALLLDCTQGPEPGSPYHAPNLDSSFFETHAIEPGKCRIALCVDTFNGAAHDPEVVEITRKAAKILEDLGHTIEETKLPINQNWSVLPMGLSPSVISAQQWKKWQAVSNHRGTP